MRKAMLLCSLLLWAPSAWANIIPIGPFVGTWSEDFEGTFPAGPAEGGARSLSIMDGAATIRGMLSFGGPLGIGPGVLGSSFSGPPLIMFDSPVTAFGGYWAGDTSYGPTDPSIDIICCGSFINVGFFGLLGEVIGGAAFKYTRNADLQHELQWHGWTSTEPIYAVGFTVPDHAVWIDGLQAQGVPEPATWVLMLAGLVGMPWRRSRQMA
jgi:hypothetical protein